MRLILLIILIAMLMPIIIDGMVCVQVAEVQGRNRCSGTYRLFRCFPEWPSLLPMEYRTDCTYHNFISIVTKG